MENFNSNPENYLKMSVPHETPEKANEALKMFYEKVEQARKECKISDLLIVIKDSAINENGKIEQFMQHGQYGNQMHGVVMAAYAFGQLKLETDEILNNLATGKP